MTAEVYTYEDASDANADTNRLHEYSINATYNGGGQLTEYKVTDI